MVVKLVRLLPVLLVVMLSLSGGTVTEVNPYDYVKNLKLVDLDSSSTLAGPLTDANAGATIVAGASFFLQLRFILKITNSPVVKLVIFLYRLT